MPTQARAPVARKNTENTTAYGAGAKPDARAVIGRWAGLESDEPLRTASFVPSQYRKRKTGLSARCRMLQTMLHGGRGGNRTPDTGIFNPCNRSSDSYGDLLLPLANQSVTRQSVPVVTGMHGHSCYPGATQTGPRAWPRPSSSPTRASPPPVRGWN